MTRETTPGLGRWREGRPARSGPSRARISTVKWVGAMFLSGLLVIAAATVVWIVWQWIFPSGPKSEFVPFLISEYQKPQVPPLPWAETDRQAIKQAQLFTRTDTDGKPGEEPTREVMGDWLARLEKSQADGAVIVYLAARAMIDAAGTIQVVAADSDPYAPKTLLPLRSVLASLKKCPARNKLLILDIMSAPPNLLDLGGTSDGVADLIRKELNKDEDPESAH